MANDVKEQYEALDTAQTAKPDAAVREANAGKGDLVDQQKSSLDDLKNGAKSGITDDFGKPLLVDSAPAPDSNSTDAVSSFRNLVSDAAQSAANLLKDTTGLDFTNELKPPGEAPSEPSDAKPGHTEKWGKREFEVHPSDGSATYQIKPGDTLSGIARDVIKGRHKDDPNYEPTPQEINEEVKALAKHNNIEDPNLIFAGRKLEIPPDPNHVKPENVDLDEKGRVTDVKYPNGSSAHVKYDANGEPVEISRSNGTTFKKEGDHWQKYDKDGNPGPTFEKITVHSPTGDIKIGDKDSPAGIVFHSDGSQTNVASDGSMVSTDANGRLEHVRTPDGNNKYLKYDDAGNLEKITSDSGKSFVKQGDHWAQVDKDGNPTGIEFKDIKANDNGDITLINDGQTIVLHPNGGTSDIRPDGSVVDQDADGKVTGVKNAKGSEVQVKYGKDGEPNAIVSDNGQWQKGKDGWTFTDKDGNVTATAKDIVVEPSGSISIQENSGFINTSHRDGSRTEKSTDGSAITENKDGQITKLEYPSGKSRDISYDKDGNPVKLSDSDGKTWVKGEDGWKQFDADGNPTGMEAQSLEVKKNGDITLKAGDQTFVIHTDGSVTEEFKDGSSVTQDSAKRASTVKYPDGRTNDITYDANGNPTEIRRSDGVTWKNEGGRWVKRDADGNKMTSIDKIEVSQNGDISFIVTGAKPLVLKHDGSLTEPE